MDNLPPSDFHFRKAWAAEAQKIAAFLSINAGGRYQPTVLHLQHHAGTTWVCEQARDEIAGILLSWISPSQYVTAVIEAIVVMDGQQALANAGTLLSYAINHYEQLNMRTLVAPANLSSSIMQVFLEHGFSTGGNEQELFLKKQLMPERISLKNKKMRPTMNTTNGQVNEQTLFEYNQEGDLIWGTYAGGAVARGVLVGKMNASYDIRFYYLQLDANGTLHEGNSSSSTEFLNDGRIVLYENWEWTGDKNGSGNSIIEEIKE